MTITPHHFNYPPFHWDNPTANTIIVGPKANGGDSSAEIQAAIDALTSSGGTVQLSTGVYTINSPIKLAGGVYVKGAGIGGDEAAGKSLFDRGTLMQGDGTSSCFYWYSDTAPTTGAEHNAKIMYGGGLEDMAFTNFVTPVQIGKAPDTVGTTRGYPGCYYGSFKRLYAYACTGWGFYFENCSMSEFQHLTVRSMSSGATGGMWFACSTGQDFYNHGNNIIKYLFVEMGSSALNSRGICFWAYNKVSGGSASFFNDNNVYHIQCNAAGDFTSTTATFTNASADITIPSADAGDYPVNKPISFTASGNGVFTLRTYFILSITDNGDSTHTINIGTDMGDNTSITATGSGNLTMCSHGWPGIEMVGHGDFANAGNELHPNSFSGIDVEGPCSNGVLMQEARCHLDINVISYVQGVTGSDNTFSSLCLRGSTLGGTFRSNSAGFSYDADSIYKGMQSLGFKTLSTSQPNWCVQEPPQGMWYDGNSSQTNMMFAGNRMGANYGLKSVTALSGSFLYPHQSFGQKCQARSSTSNYTLSLFNAGQIMYTGGNAVTWTLPALVDSAGGNAGSTTGVTFEILNDASAAVALTLNCNTGDFVNGDATKTSFTLNQFDSIKLRAVYDGAVAYWQVLGYWDHSAGAL